MGVKNTVTRLSPHHPRVDLDEQKNNGTPIDPKSNFNPVHDIHPLVDDSSFGSDEDELCRSPSWYHFRPSPAKSDSSNTLLDGGACYVAQVKAAYHERDFHNIIGKECINGALYYLVDWIPTLVRGHALRKAQVHPLISCFEVRNLLPFVSEFSMVAIEESSTVQGC